MDPFIYIFAGIAIGIGVGRFTAGAFVWKRALLAGVVALIVALGVLIFVDQLPCFLGVPNCD